jgi:hypothetical protein
MATLKWDQTGERFYQQGVDRGVLYPSSGNIVAWNGLTSIDVHAKGGTAKAYYLDGRKYHNLPSPEDFSATLKAYMYPDEFAECDGMGRVHSGLMAYQQPRKQFSLSWRTFTGSDLRPEHGYKIHILYNALAEPSPRTYNTIGQTNAPLEFSWELTALPVNTPNFRPSAYFEIDTRSSNPSAVADIEAILYGTTEADPELPTIAELITVFDAYAVLAVTDNGDGSFTVDGPDDAIVMVDANTFQITWPSAVPIDDDTWQISSL